MKVFSALAVAVALTIPSTASIASFQVAATTASNQPDVIAKIVSSSRDSVVLIETFDAAHNSLALGSGFIVSTDGKILTNFHVIKGASSAVAKLANGSLFAIDGMIVGSEPDDVALLKVSGNGLRALRLGNSSDVVAGQHVIALGSPLGLQNTVSDGIVSALRTVDTRTWIQTTAPISPGNSGGPLLDLDGKVIGIITAYIRGGENLNLAIPINAAKTLVSSALKPVALNNIGQSPSAGQTPPYAASIQSQSTIWSSLTSNHHFKVHVDGDHVYAEWVDIPADLQSAGAFSTIDVNKNGNIWTGKNRGFTTFTNGGGCHFEFDAEITSMSPTRIEGRVQAATSFNPQTCAGMRPKWADFVWVLAE